MNLKLKSQSVPEKSVCDIEYELLLKRRAYEREQKNEKYKFEKSVRHLDELYASGVMGATLSEMPKNTLIKRSLEKSMSKRNSDKKILIVGDGGFGSLGKLGRMQSMYFDGEPIVSVPSDIPIYDRFGELSEVAKLFASLTGTFSMELVGGTDLFRPMGFTKSKEECDRFTITTGRCGYFKRSCRGVDCGKFKRG